MAAPLFLVLLAAFILILIIQQVVLSRSLKEPKDEFSGFERYSSSDGVVTKPREEDNWDSARAEEVQPGCERVGYTINSPSLWCPQQASQVNT